MYNEYQSTLALRYTFFRYKFSNMASSRWENFKKTTATFWKTIYPQSLFILSKQTKRKKNNKEKYPIYRICTNDFKEVGKTALWCPTEVSYRSGNFSAIIWRNQKINLHLWVSFLSRGRHLRWGKGHIKLVRLSSFYGIKDGITFLKHETQFFFQFKFMSPVIGKSDTCLHFMRHCYARSF